MKKVYYVGLDTHKESIAIAITPGGATLRGAHFRATRGERSEHLPKIRGTRSSLCSHRWWRWLRLDGVSPHRDLEKWFRVPWRPTPIPPNPSSRKRFSPALMIEFPIPRTASIRKKMGGARENHTATALPKRWPAVVPPPIRVVVTPLWSALAPEKTRDKYFPQRGKEKRESRQITTR